MIFTSDSPAKNVVSRMLLSGVFIIAIRGGEFARLELQAAENTTLPNAAQEQASAASQGTRYFEPKTVEVENRGSGADLARAARLFAALSCTVDRH